MSIKRKYLIREHRNGLGEIHYTIAERERFFGIPRWETSCTWGMYGKGCERIFKTFDEAARECAQISKRLAGCSYQLVSEKEIEA